MILIDTSIWIDHLRARDAALSRLLEAGQALAHPFVIGELALGNLKNRATLIGLLQELPKASVATDEEVLLFIGRHGLSGLGIGYIDAHLLAATKLTPGSVLWTRDKRLQAVASRLDLANDSMH
jgi:predicted nucleic acid-binding protein